MHVGMSSTGFSWTIKLTIKCEVQAFDENSPLYWGGWSIRLRLEIRKNCSKIKTIIEY